MFNDIKLIDDEKVKNIQTFNIKCYSDEEFLKIKDSIIKGYLICLLLILIPFRDIISVQDFRTQVITKKSKNEL